MRVISPLSREPLNLIVVTRAIYTVSPTHVTRMSARVCAQVEFVKLNEEVLHRIAGVPTWEINFVNNNDVFIRFLREFHLYTSGCANCVWHSVFYLVSRDEQTSKERALVAICASFSVISCSKRKLLQAGICIPSLMGRECIGCAVPTFFFLLDEEKYVYLEQNALVRVSVEKRRLVSYG